MLDHTFSFPSLRRFAVMDRGIGGLSLLRRARSRLAGDNWLYFADIADFPRGSQTIEGLTARLRLSTVADGLNGQGNLTVEAGSDVIAGIAR